MKSTRFLILVGVAVVATLAFSLISLKERYRVESRNRAVELVAEWDAIEALAASQALPIGDALESLKKAGLGAVALREQNIGDLIDDGVLQLQTGENPDEIALIGGEAAVGRAARGYGIRFMGPDLPDRNELASKKALVVKGKSAGLLRTVDVGVDSAAGQLALEKGLRIYARGGNPLGANAAAVLGTVDWLRESGAIAFLPEGDQVLGRRANLTTLKEALARNQMLYVSPEFAKLGGDLNMVIAAPENVVRLHSAQAAELDKMTLGEAIERYVRAGRERNIRALLLRPLEYSSEKPLDALVEFVGKVGARLAREGGAVGPAKVFEAPRVPQWNFAAIGLAASLVAIYAVSLLITVPFWVGFFSVICLALGAGAWMPEIRSYSALMAAMAFPLAAYGFLMASRHSNLIVHLTLMAGVSLVGGLAVGGLLNDLPYLVRAEQFAGVKLAHFFPILLAGYFLASRLIDWREGLKSPVTWLQAFLAIVILVALAFMFARTGNDNPAAVSGLEMKLRSVLDNVLPVRPRTKEFLIGYPALVVGLGLLMRARKDPAFSGKGWAVLALMVGAIALTSEVNSMCHLHTPLDVGLLRIAVGFVLGGIIGAAAWKALLLGLPKSGNLA